MTNRELKDAIENEPCRCESGFTCDRCDWLEEMSAIQYGDNRYDPDDSHDLAEPNFAGLPPPRLRKRDA